ncbi:hypothetical protein BC834DRAFT_847302 [Gloeopeniophorella convolvens]|nr:hypothetical protein BC834DRAFT_847302 [Gloeopeniophorella convolvens]
MVLPSVKLSKARMVPMRPLHSVYCYVRRARNPNARQGTWRQGDDSTLKQAVWAFRHKLECVVRVQQSLRSETSDLGILPCEVIGLSWVAKDETLVPTGFGFRFPRNQKKLPFPGAPISFRVCVTFRDSPSLSGGPEAFQDLRLILLLIRPPNPHPITPSDYSNSPWSTSLARLRISAYPSSAKQCRMKWNSQLRTLALNGGQQPMWSSADEYVLAVKIASLHVTSDNEMSGRVFLTLVGTCGGGGPEEEVGGLENAAADAECPFACYRGSLRGIVAHRHVCKAYKGILDRFMEARAENKRKAPDPPQEGSAPDKRVHMDVQGQEGPATSYLLRRTVIRQHGVYGVRRCLFAIKPQDASRSAERAKRAVPPPHEERLSQPRAHQTSASAVIARPIKGRYVIREYAVS